MTSMVMPLARELFATAQLSWTAGVVKAVALPATALDFTEQYLSDISLGSRIAVSEAIGSRTAVNGICAGTPASLGAVLDSREIAFVVLYKDTGVESTSLLIACMEMVIPPFAPVGVEYLIYPDATLGGYFRL